MKGGGVTTDHPYYLPLCRRDSNFKVAMQRLMSCDPRALWPGSGMSETTLSCHKFQASRIQAAEKLHCKTNQLRRILDSCEDGRKEGSEERRMFLLVNEIAKLASRDVKIADQLGRISDEADRIRQKFQRYQTWSVSGGLSPNVELDSETAIGSSFDDLSISPATIPRTADAATLSPRFEEYKRRDRQFTNYPFSLCPTLTVSAHNPVGHFQEHTSSRDMKVGENQTAAGRPINLPRSHSIFYSPELEGGLKDKEKHSARAVKVTKNQIINKDTTENKVHDVEIYISDYDNKLPDEEKSSMRFELVPCPDGIIGRDSRHKTSRKVAPATKLPCKEEIDIRRENRKNREETSVDNTDKRTRRKIDSDKFRDSKPNNTSSGGVTSSTFPRQQKSRPSEIKDHLEGSEKNAQHHVREKGKPPQVPVKKLNLSMIKKRTTRKDQL